jgi:hypothetical protein
MTARLFPDMPPEREKIALEKLCLARRVNSLVHHADVVEATGGDPAPLHAEIHRCVRAIHFIDELLTVQGG